MKEYKPAHEVILGELTNRFYKPFSTAVWFSQHAEQSAFLGVLYLLRKIYIPYEFFAVAIEKLTGIRDKIHVGNIGLVSATIRLELNKAITDLRQRQKEMDGEKGQDS